jgi:hypothetical protein
MNRVRVRSAIFKEGTRFRAYVWSWVCTSAQTLKHIFFFQKGQEG